MNLLPASITNTKIWRTTLAAFTDDPYVAERERLRSTFSSFRERCGYLAGEIRKELPDLTVHDLSHLDALWEIGSTIVGEDYLLTPTEVFVLGGAILLHDLSMSVAATEGGYDKIKADPRWADLVTFEYQNAYGRIPVIEELAQPESRLKNKALFNLLRQIHAENAERLAFLSFQAKNSTPQFLIEDTEIRQTFGRIIGQIAHSHWWSITEVERSFSRVIGAPHWCPPEWTVDPLRLACILRVADASHLDARRAPAFLKAFTNLSPASEEHWVFQGKLNKAYLGDDALVFTSGQAFHLNEASAWWLCLDTLRMTDRELRSVDALFAERGSPRFAAKRVAGVDTPERLSSYIHTDGWLPINAMVHVTDLPSIIHSIGGEELYGKHPKVALRELIQNACDAIRARRVYEKRDASFGEIKVILTETAQGEFFLNVTDTGIGMSQRVLTDFLLDFGRSFWGSPQMQEELPGLLSSGIKPVGKYGIGFFSVFMIAEHVQVATRRPDMAARDTLVLEFSSGLEGRPILRQADKQEQLLEGGTYVKIKLKKSPYGRDGLLFDHHQEEDKSLAEVCCEISPAIDANLYVNEKGSEKRVVGANDWQDMDGVELLKRMDLLTHSPVKEEDLLNYRVKAANNLRHLVSDAGEVIGRAFISIGHALHDESLIDLSGIVAVGGLRACSLSGISGILLGRPARASRDTALPLVSDAILSAWAEEQADLVSDLWEKPEQQAACAQYIRMCGGSTKSLPICMYQGNWLSAEGIATMSNPPEVAIVVDSFTIDYKLELLGSYTLEPNVFITRMWGIPGLLQGRGDVQWPKGLYTGFVSGGGSIPVTLAGAVIQSLYTAWRSPLSDIHDMDFERETDVKIGVVDGREIRVSALSISRPKAQALL